MVDGWCSGAKSDASAGQRRHNQDDLPREQGAHWDDHHQNSFWRWSGTKIMGWKVSFPGCGRELWESAKAIRHWSPKDPRRVWRVHWYQNLPKVGKYQMEVKLWKRTLCRQTEEHIRRSVATCEEGVGSRQSQVQLNSLRNHIFWHFPDSCRWLWSRPPWQLASQTAFWWPWQGEKVYSL